MAINKPGYAVPPAVLSDTGLWLRQIASSVIGLMSGRMNVCLDVTLTANAASTTVTDARISAFCALVPVPLTAHAAAEIAAGGFYVSAQQKGQATLTHANNSQADRNFRIVIVG